MLHSHRSHDHMDVRRDDTAQPGDGRRRAGASLVTVAPVVTQAWRGGARQARLARMLPMVDVRSIGLREARVAGELLAVSGTSDAVDALIVMVALSGNQLLTKSADPESAVSRIRAPLRAVINAIA